MSESNHSVCKDLQPALQVLQSEYGLGIKETQVDPRNGNVAFYFAEEISDQALAWCKRNYSNNPNLKFGNGWIACHAHFCSINSASVKRARDNKKSAQSKKWISKIVSEWLYALADLLFTVGGIWMFALSVVKHDWWNLLIATSCILLFGFAFVLQIKAIVTGLVRKSSATVFKLHVQRDSVAAGDDVDAPHQIELSVLSDATVEQVLSSILAKKYLASIQGGKATWIFKGRRQPLAVVAQQWEYPKYLVDPLAWMTAYLYVNDYTVQFDYQAQSDPDRVFEALRDGTPLPDRYDAKSN